jgi:acetyl-CoA carboxylase carboxyl transferase subunit beta
MNWIRKILRAGEKIRKVIKERPSVKEMADSLWKSCPSCRKLTSKEKIRENYFICECGFHFDIPPRERLARLGFLNGKYEVIASPEYSDPDPLKFEYCGTKYISKRKNYQKITKQETALFCVYGKIGSISSVVVCSNFKFGGGAWSPDESEHFVTAAQKAIDEKVDLFLTIFQTGGVAVTTGVTGLASAMVKSTIALENLKKHNIVTIAIASSKTTGGPYASAFFNHELVGIESSSSTDILFSGKRVSANVSQNSTIPEDFGNALRVQKSGLCDFVLNNRHEIRATVLTLTKILKKKNKTTSVEATNENQEDPQQITSAAS